MTYSAYLFDLDGTLVDTAPDLMRALNRTLADAGCPPVGEALTRHWVGHGVYAMLTAALAHNDMRLPEERLKELMATCLDHYGAHIADYSKPYPAVVETLAALKERAPLAVVTNKPADLACDLLAGTRLARFFPVVVGRGTTDRNKPDPKPAEYACDALEVPVEQALFVGDSRTDVHCARAAGCEVAIFRHGYNHGEDPDAMGADRVFDSLDELL